MFTFFEEHGQFFPQAALRMVRRDLVENHGIRFYEGIIHEDVLFTFQTLVVSRRSSFLNESIYLRRIRANSTMTAPKRTIANVRGHFLCVREIKRWLSLNIDGLDESFLAAATHRATDYLLLAARDWFNDVDPQEQARFLAELSPETRLAFYEDVIQPGATIERLNKEFYGSVTYRLGNVILAAPRWVRDRISSLMKYMKER